MANRNRSSKQKGVLVFSVLALIMGIVAIIGGLMIFAGGALIAVDAGGASVTAEGVTVSGADVAGMAGAAGIIFFVSGIFALLQGIFGIRAANDGAKAMPFIVFTTISLVLNIIALITALTQGDNNYAYVSAVVIDAVCVWLGVGVRNEARY